MDIAAKKGITITHISNAEKAEVKKLAEDAYETYKTTAEAKGLPARKVFGPKISNWETQGWKIGTDSWKVHFFLILRHYYSLVGIGVLDKGAKTRSP